MIRPVLAARRSIGGPLAVSPPAGFIIYDEFTAANGTTLSGRAPSPINSPGNTWVVHLATWTISSNRANKSGGGGNNAVSVNAGVANCTVVCDVTVVNTAERHGIGVRVTDQNNLWYLSWRNTGVVELIERNATVVTVRSSAALVLTAGNTYQFKVVANGATLTGYIDDVQYVTYGSATFNQAVTSHGLFVGASGAVAWDNFRVLP